MNWRTLDLNLLRVLDAMLRERNTTRVGAKIGLSQPAVSSALGRLRQALGDPLFVRERNRMVPTRFAELLEEPVRRALGELEMALTGGTEFDPSRSVRDFRLAVDDYLAELLLPGLVNLLAVQAPGIRLQLLPIDTYAIRRALAEGTVDMAIARSDEAPTWVESALALHASPTAVAGRKNKALRRAGVKPGETMPLDVFCALPHAFFAPDGATSGFEDEALAKIGRRRRIVLTVPNFFSLGRLLARTDLLGTMPDRYALAVADQLGLAVYRLPFEMLAVPLHLFWHRRHTDDPEHRWIRERILELLRPMVASGNQAPARRRLSKH